MRPLTASDILKAWEQGEAQSAIDRALTVLAVACPELSHDELAALGIGERDARLFELRALTFGPRLDGFTPCPECGERLEFTFDAAAIRDRSLTPSAEAEFEFEANGYALRFRLPNSRDLAAVAVCDDVAAARRLLAERCVVRASGAEQTAVCSHTGQTEVRPTFSEDVIAQLAERIDQCAPDAELTLDFVCPSCGNGWQAPLDIAAFFWAEIAAEARRLLREVHLLASAYGWREAEILAMSARRRQAYLEMIG